VERDEAAMKLWWAKLCTSSPRYEAWRQILGSDDVPLKSPGSGPTMLGNEKVEVHLLDLVKMTPEQRTRLIDWVVEKFGEKRELVESEIYLVGFPIRTEDVAVFFDMRAFL
jgi:hypothetical protein